MPMHQLGADDAPYFEHRPPAAEGGLTFVFFNALTGDAASWEAGIAPALRTAGHGTLLWKLPRPEGQPVRRARGGQRAAESSPTR